MFNNRRRLRRWTAQVLIVWLFGLAMSVANACALGESVHHRSDAAMTAASHDSDSQKHHHDDEQGDTAKVDCLNFCEKSSIGAPQLKVVDDLSTLGFALLASNTLSVSGLAEPTAGQLVVDSPHLGGGPPPRIAFQRLTL